MDKGVGGLTGEGRQIVEEALQRWDRELGHMASGEPICMMTRDSLPDDSGQLGDSLVGQCSAVTWLFLNRF